MTESEAKTKLPTFLHLPTKEQIKEFQKGAHYRTNFPDLTSIPEPQVTDDELREKIGAATMLLFVLVSILGILFLIALLYFSGWWR